MVARMVARSLWVQVDPRSTPMSSIFFHKDLVKKIFLCLSIQEEQLSVNGKCTLNLWEAKNGHE